MNKIVICGKEYPCRLTMGAMVRYKRSTGHDVSEMKDTDISAMIEFMYHCTASACNADGVPLDMDLEMFADRLEPEAMNDFYASNEAAKKKSRSKKA